MSFGLTLGDYYVIGAYFVLSMFAGVFAFRSSQSGTEDYFVAARKLTLPAFVATTVSTFYGGILGVSEYSYLYGLSNWFVFGVPYYLYTLIFAWKLAGAAQGARLMSVPDQLERAYGKPAAMLGAGFLFMTAVPGAYLLMVTQLLQMAFGLPLMVALPIAIVTSSIYIVTGGLRSVIYADIVQFVLMFVGFGVLVITAMVKLGGLAYLQQTVPAAHFTPTGGLPFASILVWYFIAMTTLVEPTFYQRCFAAKDASTARRGMLISILFWIVFDFMTTTCGLYARSLFPNLDTPSQSYALLAGQLLPQFARGLFWTAMFATVMSTVNSYSFLSAVTLGRDIIWRSRSTSARNDALLTRWTQLGLVITLIIATMITLMSDSVIAIWKEIGSIFGPALVLPLLTSWRERWKLSARMVVWAMALTCIVALLWTLSKYATTSGGYLYGVEPIYPSLVTALFCWLIDRRVKR